MLSTDSNYTKIESHGDNCERNRNGDKVGIEKRELDNLESSE